jgi:lipopolysaccharide transport system permease protein
MNADTPTPNHPDTRQSQTVTVYRPNMRHELGLFHTWVVMVQNILGARELIWQLFKRDFFAAYKKSFIGVAWVFITPAVGILSWVFLQKTGLLNPGDVGVPYPVYVLMGTSMYGLFMSFYGAAAGTLQAGGGLMMQVKYPHEALLFKQVASNLANFLIGFVFNIVVLLIFRVTPSWGILLFPLVAIPMFFLATAFGLMMSMISVVAMDMSNIVGMGMQFLMYGMPIIYSNEVSNQFIQTVIKWNPLTYLVCSCRDMILFGRLYNVQGYFIVSGISLLLFMVSWRLFYVSEDKLVERMI